tara:strand:- start:192 stop:1253 length:1062 start_codon:yes stop_codon:yes gene_type:complete
MKLLTIVGARPQFIKAATISRQVALRSDIREVIVHTGQHYDTNMSDIFFEELNIPKPNHHLGIGGGSHGAMTGRQLEAIEAVLVEERPDYVLVYGDTNSTLAGALAAVKLHIPIAHVEAGLRSFNRAMPEEINRVLADHVSTMLFSPTEEAIRNLAMEGIQGSHVRLVGDVMLDATRYYASRAREPKWFSDLNIVASDFILCTIHRAENTDDPKRLEGILKGLGGAHAAVILPLHPRTRGVLETAKITIPANVRLVSPVGYLEMIWLEMHCRAIATDSGGVQKEAYFHGKPCVTLREETEWVELVDVGANVLVGSDPYSIQAALKTPSSVSFDSGLYGDGNAAEQVLSALLSH